jgi:hypothetical protein
VVVVGEGRLLGDSRTVLRGLRVLLLLLQHAPLLCVLLARSLGGSSLVLRRDKVRCAPLNCMDVGQVFVKPQTPKLLVLLCVILAQLHDLDLERAASAIA